MLISIKEVMARYRVGVWRVDRWQVDQNLGFPRPILLRKRRYWKLREIEAFEARFSNRFGAQPEKQTA